MRPAWASAWSDRDFRQMVLVGFAIVYFVVMFDLARTLTTCLSRLLGLIPLFS